MRRVHWFSVVALGLSAFSAGFGLRGLLTPVPARPPWQRIEVAIDLPDGRTETDSFYVRCTDPDEKAVIESWGWQRVTDL